jgi:uncharacterized repeat protein (TIGR03803 family)
MDRRTHHLNWIGVRGRAAAALALAIMLVPTIGCPLFGGGSSSSSSGSGSGSGPAHSYTESVLYSFAGAPDGANPYSSGLVQDAQGNLYGTTAAGGDASCSGTIGTGCGIVFKLDTAGNEIVLHSFTGPDGAVPYAGVVLDAQGNLYGTTLAGGANGVGTVFKVDANGNETVLYSFCAFLNPACNNNGGEPQAGLVRDAQGNLYGTTIFGGAFDAGTVFELSTSGLETALYTFTGTGSSVPQAGLALDAQGNLYGTTLNGGTHGGGTVFKVDPFGNQTVLYNFTQEEGPYPGVVLDAQGNLYGVTGAGGTPSGCGGGGCGTVFKIDAAGNESVLVNLAAQNGGWGPFGGLVLDAQGNLYGTTSGGHTADGGSSNCVDGCGTVFAIDTSGNYSVLYNFLGGADGSDPDAALVVDAQGNLYGTTRGGGASGNGTVFKLTP